MIAPKRIHRQPQHQLAQQEPTFQQAQLELSGPIVRGPAGLKENRYSSSTRLG
jgi:hypothetical protein